MLGFSSTTPSTGRLLGACTSTPFYMIIYTACLEQPLQSCAKSSIKKKVIALKSGMHHLLELTDRGHASITVTVEQKRPLLLHRTD